MWPDDCAESSQAPLVLFTYMNPIISFGEAELPRAAAAAGIDALLIVDFAAGRGAGVATRSRGRRARGDSFVGAHNAF